MKTIVDPLLNTLTDLLRSRALLQLEVLALRQQLVKVFPFTGYSFDVKKRRLLSDGVFGRDRFRNNKVKCIGKHSC